MKIFNNLRVAAFIAMSAAASGCSGHRLSSLANAPPPATVAGESPVTASSAPANALAAPAIFYLDHSALSARYLNALINDPALVGAYNGYYLKQKQPTAKLWQNFKKAADQVLRLATLYPAAAVGASAYRSVTKAESVVKKEFSAEEKTASDVEHDIRLATAKIAQQLNAQFVMDIQSSPLLYIAPAWDLTDRVLADLIQSKKEHP